MNIIAIIIFAASYTFTPEDAFNYTPQSDTLELNIRPVDASAWTNIPTVVTNEPWKSLFEMRDKVDQLWAERNSRLAEIEERKAKYRKRQEEYAKSQSAIERVKENQKNRKRKSAIGKSLPTGGSKK